MARSTGSNRERRGEELRQRFAELFIEQVQSGLSQQGFCRKVGVTHAQFKYWKYKAPRVEEGARTRPEFLPVAVALPLPSGFETNRPEAPSGVSLSFPEGVVVRLDVDFDGASLRRALQALRDPKC